MGVMIYANGERYDGFWKEGLWEPKGRRIFANGDVYLGQYKSGQKHGTGWLQTVNEKGIKCIYTGDFEHDAIQG